MGTPVKKTKYEVVAPSSSKYEVVPPPAKNADDQPHFSAAPSFPSVGWFKKKGYEIADKVTNALPAAGGVAGGIVGGTGGTVGGFGVGGPPGAVGGAIVGGAAGESARQLARRVIFPPSKGWESGIPQTSGEAAKDIGIEGLKQGAYEIGGQGMRAIGKVAAPKLAEAAVAPGKRLLKSIPDNAAPIGETILKESSGVRPKTIVGQLDSQIAAHSAAEDAALNAAKTAGKKVPLIPSRQIASSELQTAISKNSPAYIKDVNKVADQLSTQYGPTGAAVGPLPDMVDPVRARQLRQGIDLSIGSWNPEAQTAIKPLQRRVYGSLTGEIHNVVPDAAEHDAAMTNLIPAREATWNTSFNPGLTRSAVERFARPTGALIGAGIGTEEGYRHGGVGGAVAGGLTGLVLPNAIASPEGLMTAARVVDSGIPSRVVRTVAPIGEGIATKPNASKKKRP